MTILRRLLTILVAVLLVAVPATLAQGAPGGGRGGPGGGGPPEGVGNRPDGVGGGRPDGAGTKKGDIYADLWVIGRYADGTPVVDDNLCVRPIVISDSALDLQPLGEADFVTATLYGDYDETAYLIPLVGDTDATLAEEDEDELEPCDVDPTSSVLPSETELGRLNLGRAPEKVVDKQLADVIVNLNDVDDVGLDPSGRLQGEATIDSPLQNMAVFQAILERGAIERVDKSGVPIGSADTSGLFLTEFQQAATALAAATPKEDDFHVYVDTVQYLSRILDIPGDTVWDTVNPLLTDARGEKFLNFAQFPGYTRQDVFKGCVAYAAGGGDWLETVVDFSTPSSDAFTGIQAFTQLTSDSRDVLVWLHDHPESVTAASSVGSSQVLVDGELTPCSAVVPPPTE